MLAGEEKQILVGNRLKLRPKTPQGHQHHAGVFVIYFEQVSMLHFFLSWYLLAQSQQ